jgi:hypothetical protein
MPHGKWKMFLCVRLGNVARQRLCRGTPHGKGRFFTVCQHVLSEKKTPNWVV